MKKTLLFLTFVLLLSSVSMAQVASIRPNHGFLGQSLNTTITLASGAMQNATPPMNYYEIYFQQGGTIIYTFSQYNPYVNFYNYWDSWSGMYVWYDSCVTNFPIPSNAPTGYYDVVMLTYPGAAWNPDTNRLVNGMLISAPAGTISGMVYFDTNQNGLYDVGELPLPNQRILITPTNDVAFTNANGEYSYFVDTGTYTTSFIPQSGFTQTSSPLNYINTVPPSVSGNDFGVYSAVYGYDHSAILNRSRIRCSITGNIRIIITNRGVLASQSKVTVITSSNLTYNSATVAPDVINGDTLTWNSIVLQPGTTQYVGGTSLSYDAPAAGQIVSITLIDSLFDLSGTFIGVYNDQWTYQVSCSFDPNDKHASPEGVLTQHYTPINSELTYLVNFQNTGNDYAYDVYIFDTLDANLDLSTFEVIGSSHEVNTQITPSGAVRFNFFNIMLPDSGLDEEGSHGWVLYKVRPNAGLPDPTEITNTSYIVFDYNYPIITNTTLNTMTALQYPQSNFTTADVTICETNCILFSNQSTSGTSYEWTFQGGSPSSSTSANPGAICYSTSGTYDVTLITTNALGSDTLTQSAYINVAPSPGIFSVVQLGDSLIAPQGYNTYQWYFNNTLISGATSYYYVATQDGDYGIVVGNANGCQSGVNIPNVIIGVTELSDSNGFMIYPNPSDGQFKISYNSVTNETAVISIIDKIGQVVKSVEYKLASGSNKIEMNTKELASGIYNVKIQIGSNVISKRLILNK